MTTIRPGTGPFFERATQGMAALRASAEKMQAQIGSGQRLARGSDDPVAAARLRGLTRADTLAQVDRANANRAATDLAFADSALGQLADQTIRARELVSLAASGTVPPSQRTAIGSELAQIHRNLLDLANARDSAGHALFGGEGVGMAYELDGLGVAQYVGTAGVGSIDLGEGQTLARGLTGPQALGFSVNGIPTDLLAVVRQLAADLQGAAADPAQAARDALGALDAGLDQVTSGQTLVGTRLAWLDLVADHRTEAGETRASEADELGGTDMATSIARLQNLMVALEASQASFSRLSGLRLFDQLR